MSYYSDKQQRVSNELHSLDDATLDGQYHAKAVSVSRNSDYKVEDYERGPTPTRSTHRYVADFDDPNFDPLAEEDDEDSPYPEVRSAVANTDDPTMPVSTIRAWFLGIIAAVVVPGLNQFFFFRYPGVVVGQLVATIISFPIGRLLAIITPRVSVFGLELNPGPFTIKEHVLVTVMASIGAYSAYATDIVAVQRVYYNQNWSFSYQWMVTMSTQLIGFSFGGFLRRFIVDPPAMIWPASLVSCALFNTLHSNHYNGAGRNSGMSRERFFYIVFAASFVWYWVPGYLFTALSYFSWVCWIAPNNVKVNQMFGYMSGLGMSVLTFDWAQISYIGSPLATPWWAEANIAFGFAFFFWLLAPILYYTNTMYSAYMPILSRATYDNTGESYDVFRILTPDMTFNQTAYEEYSPMFISATFSITYGLSFAAITSTVVHTILYYRKQIWNQARRSLREQPDIHARLLSRYDQVPHWWYSAIFVITFVFGIAAVTAFPTGLPVWAFIMALVIAVIYVIPVGIIQAITNQQIGLNVITELIVGYMLPGRPIPMMLFKTYGYVTMAQALSFASDFKLGMYMKIPPRTMFAAQVAAAAIACTTQLGVQAWMFEHINGICTTDAVFICPTTQVFGAASVIWGVIGPQRQFSIGQIYHGLTYFFLAGAIAPIIPWLITRRYPKSWVKFINFPVIFSGTALMPPATAVNYVPWAIVGFIFQYVIRRRYFSWWTRYNYVLSAALDSGVAIAAVVIFFALQFPKHGKIGADSIQTWWGNTVYYNNLDGANVALKSIPEDTGFFGPSTW